MTVGIVVAREPTGSAWEPYAWRALEAVVPAPPLEAWTLLRETAGRAVYLAGHAPVELHRKEASGYVDNLLQEAPVLYVVLRRTDADWPPVSLLLVTASPTEVQAYGEGGDEVIGPVPMPAAVRERVAAFAAEHHVDEVFVKRRRRAHVEAEEHKFGQEPIVELRERMRRRQGEPDGEAS